jgi:hypothetical protein
MLKESLTKHKRQPSRQRNAAKKGAREVRLSPKAIGPSGAVSLGTNQLGPLCIRCGIKRLACALANTPRAGAK